ncbi:hypothetical protein CDV36_016498 [Fusarium kuroshium]|uniref:Uncharacterized protein n=1 Tax=Fusarium kuroshium TaxID=2010991 RepID=A0A3M2QM73_9HYPO|nr:hypothetical protein CDV36_016498 [Fusarium kuroshium]
MLFDQLHLLDNIADRLRPYTSEQTMHPEQPAKRQKSLLRPNNTLGRLCRIKLQQLGLYQPKPLPLSPYNPL